MNPPPDVISRFHGEISRMTQRLEELFRVHREFEIEFASAFHAGTCLEHPTRGRDIETLCLQGTKTELECDESVEVLSGDSSTDLVLQNSSDEYSWGHATVCQNRDSSVKVARLTVNRQESVSSMDSIEGMIPQTLPEQWPGCLQPRRELEEGKVREVSFCASTQSNSVQLPERKMSSRNREWSFQALNPHSPIGALADMVGAMVLLVDLTQIPYMLAWDVPVEGVYTYFFWFMVLYWTLDIVRTFLTGYTSSGEVELRLRVVCLRYLRTWFAVDFTIVLIDWTSVLASLLMDLSMDASSYRMFRLAKVGRLVRIFALFRIFRMCRFFEDFIDKFQSSGTRVFTKIFGIFFVVLWMNHFICCLWVSVGSWESDTGSTWMNGYDDAHFLYMYTTSFHWSMAQMTLGATEVEATNTSERIVTIIMLLIGLVFSSTLVSSLSATLIGYQMQSGVAREQMRLLRQFLRERSVQSGLSFRVKQQAEHRLTYKPPLLEEEVTGLCLLSPSLLSELRDEMYAPVLEAHPLFCLWSMFSSSTTRELTDTIADFSFHSPPDDIFVAGHTCKNAFYLAKGTLTYAQYPESSISPVTTERSVGPNTWLCEASLWSEWIHVGSAEATSPCQLLGVQGEMVFSIASKHRFISEVTRQYGRQFHKCVVSARPPNEWPDDLYVPFTDWVDVVCSMHENVRTAIGLDALARMSPPNVFTSRKWAFAHARLKEEVMDGRSTVILNPRGQAERVVFVTALHITGDGQRFLAQIAKWDAQLGSALRPIVELPGSAHEFRESPFDAAQRILRTKFEAEDAFVDAHNLEREVSYKESEGYRVQTKYVRNVFRVSLGKPLCLTGYRAQALAADVEELLPKQRSFVYGRPAVISSGISDVLGEREVYVLKQPEKLTFYMWVNQCEFARLQEPDHGNKICQWLHTLNLDLSFVEPEMESEAQ